MARVEKYMAVAEEAAWGTEEAAVDYMAAFNVRPQQKKRWEPIETIAASYLNDAEITGEIGGVAWDFPVNPVDGTGWLLKWIMGDPATSGTADPYTHVYKTDDVIRSLTALVGSKDLTEEPYAGQVLDTLEFSCAPGGYLIATPTIFGTKKEADNSIGSPSFSGIRPFQHSDITLEIDTVDKSKYAGTLSIGIAANYKKDELTAGSTEIQNQPLHTLRGFKWSIELLRYDDALRTAYNAGNAVDIMVKFTGAASSELQFDMSDAKIDTYRHDVNKRDVETHVFSGFATYDDTDATELIATLLNSDSDYPDAS